MSRRSGSDSRRHRHTSARTNRRLQVEVGWTPSIRLIQGTGSVVLDVLIVLEGFLRRQPLQCMVLVPEHAFFTAQIFSSSTEATLSGNLPNTEQNGGMEQSSDIPPHPSCICCGSNCG